MTISPFGNVGTAIYGSTTKISSLNCAVTQAIPAGSTLMWSAVFEGSGPTQVNVTVTDTHGNTGTQTVSAISGATRQVVHGYMPVVTGLASGDNVNFATDASRNHWGLVLDRFSGLLTSAIDKTASNGASSGLAMNGGTTAATAQASELVYGAFAAAPAAVISVTGGSGFTLGGSVATNSGSNDNLTATCYKIVSATGTQSAVITQAATAAYAGVTATYMAAVTQTLRPTIDVTTASWTKQPSGAATYAATVSDQDDTTYSRSPTNPDGTLVLKVGLPTPSPLPVAGYGANIGARLRANSFSSNTVKVALYNGSTKLKEGTFAVTGSVVEYDVALSAADVAAVTAANSTWVGLSLQVTPVAS